MSFNCECRKPYMVSLSDGRDFKVVCMSDNCLCICDFNIKECRSKDCQCSCSKGKFEDCRHTEHRCICIMYGAQNCKSMKHACSCTNVKVDDKVNYCKVEEHNYCICRTNINLCKGRYYKGNFANTTTHECNCVNGICKAERHDCICLSEPWSCRATNIYNSHICSCSKVGRSNCKALTHVEKKEEVEEVKKKKKLFFCF